MRTRALCATIVVAVFATYCLVEAEGAWTFSEQDSLNYLYYAITSYCPKSQIEDWTCEYCIMPSQQDFKFYKTLHNDKTGTFGYIGYHPLNATIYVVFRGSVNTRNWIVDFLFPLKSVFKNLPGIKVHSGFYDAYKDLAPSIHKDVAHLFQNECVNCTILVTGHSLGAALATLCAADLAYEGYKGYVKSYSYGDPRVGNYNFTRFYKAYVPDTFRVVNNKDIVPAVPLVEMGFWHVTTEVWEHGANNSVYTTCSSETGEDPTCSDSVIADSAKDHVNYMNIPCGCNSTSAAELEAMAADLATKLRAREVGLSKPLN